MTPAADAWDGLPDPTACATCGRDSCEGHEAPPPSSRRRLARQTVAQIIDAPPPVEIIEGIAFEDALTVFVAESGGGKTFVNLSQAAAVVGPDMSWYGRRVEHGSAAYITYEGDAMGMRLRALRDVQRCDLTHLHLTRASLPLSPRLSRDGIEEPSPGELDVIEWLADVQRDIDTHGHPPLRVLWVDTIRASLAGSEDASENAAAYLRAVRRILSTAPGCAGILTHHAGWQDGDTKRKRERGSSAWRGNADATIYLEAGDYDPLRRETPITLHTHKARDAGQAAPLHLVRRVVDLDICDRYGRAYTSCVIATDPRSADDRAAERSAHEAAAMQAFDQRVLAAIHEHPAMATSAEKLAKLLTGRKQAYTEALARLAQRGLAVDGGRGKPYRLTEAGFRALKGGQS